MSELRKLIDRVWLGSEQRSWVRGVLGRPNGDGTFTVVSATRPDAFYVRVSQEGRQSVTLAKHVGRVPARAGLPVKMRLENGTYVIHSVDDFYFSAATADDTPNTTGVSFHTHRSDTALAYELEAKLFEPGRSFWYEDFTVYVNPFRYYQNGWQWYEGGLLALDAYMPSTTGKWRWILIGVDPATNLAVAVAGSDYDSADELTIDLLNAITFTGYIPLGAVKAAESDTTLNDTTRFFDAGAWHGGAVAYAQMTSIAQGYFIGRATTGTGAPEAVDATGFGLELDSGALKRSALTGDVLATIGSNSTTIATNAVTDAKFRNSPARSVVANATNTTGNVGDVTATNASNAVLMEQGGLLVFDTIATVNIDDDAITDAKLADMAEARVKGRALGAGTGAPGDLTGTQVAAIAGGTLYIDNVGVGNVGVGEDTLATYTVPASRLSTRATLWFEAAGTYGANSNSKRIRVYFGGTGGTAVFDQTVTTIGGSWFLRGRIVAVGSSAERTTVEYQHTGQPAALQYTEHTEALSGALDLLVTGEATGDDDIDLRTFTVGWTPPV